MRISDIKEAQLAMVNLHREIETYVDFLVENPFIVTLDSLLDHQHLVLESGLNFDRLHKYMERKIREWTEESEAFDRNEAQLRMLVRHKLGDDSAELSEIDRIRAGLVQPTYPFPPPCPEEFTSTMSRIRDMERRAKDRITNESSGR